MFGGDIVLFFYLMFYVPNHNFSFMSGCFEQQLSNENKISCINNTAQTLGSELLSHKSGTSLSYSALLRGCCIEYVIAHYLYYQSK